jgi:poly(A) polymerase
MKRITAKWLKEPALQRVFAIIAAAGGDARVAGGAVRNAIMGEPVGDVDLATTLSPHKVTEVFVSAGHSVYPTGIDHGTVTVVIDHRSFEITTLRRDVSTDGRRAVVSFTDDWMQDALRRDFTMNALYCDAAGKIFDYTNGYDDILRNRIMFVGVASRRIKEDYLRILRYFRFMAVYPNLKADTTGLAACIKLKSGLRTLSAERLAQEMFKLLVGPKAVTVLKMMAVNKVLKNIIPYTDDFRVVGRLPADPLLRAFVLAKDPKALREDWRLSNDQTKRIETLLDIPAPSPKLRENEQRRILYAFGAQAWIDSVSVAWARSHVPLSDPAWKRMLTLPRRWPMPVFPVSGRDLIDIGHVPGPAMGLDLKQLEERWIASDFKPTKQDLLESLRGT